MTRLIPLLLFFVQIATSITAQNVLHGFHFGDTTVFTFNPSDTLNYVSKKESLDTAGCQLWQIGRTNKTFFLPPSPMPYINGIMTDTSAPYPVNANDWFVLRLDRDYYFNPIVIFTHKFQTDSSNDGGVVEYSYDDGITWNNVMGDCNIDTFAIPVEGVLTDNFYTYTDTLATGEPAFTGTSNGWQTSAFQFYWYPMVKTTGGPHCLKSDSILVRFRFISDSVSDTLDGWMINRIVVEHDEYWGSVSGVNKHKQLNVYPNPSNGIFYFPALAGKQNYSIEIINSLGQSILQQGYSTIIDLSVYPRGLYMYKVSNESDTYTGRILLE